MWNRLKSFFTEAQYEFRHINWPTLTETRRLTLIVIGLSLGIAVFLGFLDFIFSYLLNQFFI